MMPVRGSGMHRLVGILSPEFSARADLSFEDIRPAVEKMLQIEVTEVNWFSAYRVHHRVADRFRVGRCFIAGDAGHVHSPAGGQGMNTGIGDAINLSWKLAHVLQGRAHASLLDTYEPERIAFARKLVATTDTAFHNIVDKKFTSSFVRKWIVPYVLPVLSRRAAFRNFAFKTVSQIRVNYRDSDLSQGRAGIVRGGDRLPWVNSGESDNFAALQSLDWQVHIYGRASPGFSNALSTLNLPVHQFPWNQAAGKAGLMEDAMYLVRPDGHVALACAKQDAEALKVFAAVRGLKFSSEPRHGVKVAC
jgi:hypothetical protein